MSNYTLKITGAGLLYYNNLTPVTDELPIPFLSLMPLFISLSRDNGSGSTVADSSIGLGLAMPNCGLPLISVDASDQSTDTFCGALKLAALKTGNTLTVDNTSGNNIYVYLKDDGDGSLGTTGYPRLFSTGTAGSADECIPTGETRTFSRSGNDIVCDNCPEPEPEPEPEVQQITKLFLDANGNTINVTTDTDGNPFTNPVDIQGDVFFEIINNILYCATSQALLDAIPRALVRSALNPGDVIGLNIPNNARTIQIIKNTTFDIFFNGELTTGSVVNIPLGGPSMGAICLHPKTRIETDEGLKCIEDVTENDLICSSISGLMNISYNIKSQQTNKFIKISKDSLGENLPSDDLYMTKGHPIKIKNKEIPAGKLVNGSTIIDVELDEPVNIYSLCTKERTTVKIHGLDVFTWGVNDWVKFSIRKNIRWDKH